jgi:hypothetical protein
LAGICGKPVYGFSGGLGGVAAAFLASSSCCCVALIRSR